MKPPVSDHPARERAIPRLSVYLESRDQAPDAAEIVDVVLEQVAEVERGRLVGRSELRRVRRNGPGEPGRGDVRAPGPGDDAGRKTLGAAYDRNQRLLAYVLALLVARGGTFRLTKIMLEECVLIGDRLGEYEDDHGAIELRVER